MSAGNRAFMGGLMLADTITTAMQRGRKIDAARRAQRDHFGTVAQLSAALVAIRTLAPEHPLNSQRVRDTIQIAGERAGSFAAAWQLEIDTMAVQLELHQAHELARQKVLLRLEKTQIERRTSFFFRNESSHFAESGALAQEGAEWVKTKAMQLAQTAGLDDPIEFKKIVQKAVELHADFVNPPQPVLTGPRPERQAPRAFRRRRM